MIFDSGTSDGRRVIVFATQRYLQLLNKSRTWYQDGTFKVSPTIFTQVFTILGTRERLRNADDQEIVPIPFVYALLSHKEQAQHIAVLQAVQTAAEKYHIRNFAPQRIMTDFEKGILNACAEVYPESPLSCCFFHLKQAVYRHIRASGLQTQYNDPDDETIRVQAHMMAALAFVPTDEVSRVFRLLQDEIDEDLLPVMQYFRETYVNGRPTRGKRKAVSPRYAAIWNQFDAAVAGQQKTNNLSEGWQNRFNIVVGKVHPDLYSALTEFQKEQAHSESMIAELSAGKIVNAAPQKKWLDVQRRLQRVVGTYKEHAEDNTEVEYLHNLAQNIYL